MTSCKKRGSLPTVCSKDTLMHTVNWPVWAHLCPCSSLGPGQDVCRLCANFTAEILVHVLWEKNPKTEQATVMDKYSSDIQEKCKDASQAGFHLLVMITSSVTGSKTQPDNSSLLPPMPEQKACFPPRSVLPGKLSAWMKDFIMSRNGARALTAGSWWPQHVGGWHARRDQRIAPGVSLLRDAPTTVHGWTKQIPPYQLETVLSRSLDVKNYSWVKGRL